MKARLQRPTSLVTQAARSTAGLSVLLFAGLVFLGAGCSREPDFEDVPPAAELFAEGQKLLKGRKILGIYKWVRYEKAIETFQAIIDNYPYSDYEIEAQLKIADAYFDDAKFDEALSYYRDFADLHPQNPKVPYTILRSALCHYNQISSIDRDQTSTHEALKYLEILSTRYPYDPETRDGEIILQQLRTRLADNMMEIGDFYLVRTQFQSAANRFRGVINEYPGLGLDPEALYKLAVCYEHMKRTEEALRLYHVVRENFSDSPYAERADERISRAE
ncbi:MAG: outer membrane protein assembly factor BamD [Myxococcota bacterium]|nr:outer membrane protein assembly factor BamD [Myxococcota bacterium]